MTLTNTILAGNIAPSSPDCYGTLTSGGSMANLTAIGYEFRPRLSREVASDPARIALPTLAERCSEYVATIALKVQAEPLENGHLQKLESALAILHRAIAMIEKTIATRPLQKPADTAA